MPEETTPLLDSTPRSSLRGQTQQGEPFNGTGDSNTTAKTKTIEEEHNAVYNRFSKGSKIGIVALISVCGLLPLFVSGSFFPSIPSISRDMDTSPSIVSLTVSVSIFAACIGALVGASYSGFYGRKPVYLVGLPLLTIGSIGVAFSRTMPELMLWRFLQTFGGSPGLSVGAGVIGDIYRLEERGTAMGVFFGACLLGPALAPLVGGVISHYASWRITQLFLGAWGLLAFICIATMYPETSIPGSRGIDKKRAELVAQNVAQGEKWFKIVWINPLKTLSLLRSPNLLAVALAGTFVLLTDYVILTPLSVTLGARYGITNQAVLGACFIPIGLGNFSQYLITHSSPLSCFVFIFPFLHSSTKRSALTILVAGAPVAGYLSDQILKRKRIQRKGEWYPEDRLIGTVFASATLVPLSVLGFGLVTTYVEGNLGLYLDFLCLFANGVGVDLVLSPSAAYIVDVMHSKSAESMAANNGLRSLLIAILLAALMPMLDNIGLAWTNAVSALLAWIGFALLWCTIRYGEQMRSWVDVGYTSIEDS
ncbi:MFS general substrate transporter [Lentinula detonsa]|uniref:MFS general substrate transporter n=1 Tax=Lentinula detonsa TaxID=2804962 RepID=A0AA38UVR8_9AGAR|nr:MFS general substrate transporter [Lentinula detonsa]